MKGLGGFPKPSAEDKRIRTEEDLPSFDDFSVLGSITPGFCCKLSTNGALGNAMFLNQEWRIQDVVARGKEVWPKGHTVSKKHILAQSFQGLAL